MNEKYVFIKTTRGDRTNIKADFNIFTYDAFIDKLKGDGRYWASWRVAELNKGEAQILSSINVSMFEELKLHEVLSKEKIEAMKFSKDIRLKYGTSGDRAKAKRIPKKDLEVGRVYVMENGSKAIYYGKCNRKVVKEKNVSYWDSRRELNEINEQGVFLRKSWYSSCKWKTFNDFSSDLYLAYSTKSCPKFIEATEIKFDIPATYNQEYTNSYTKSLDIEFLDVR